MMINPPPAQPFSVSRFFITVFFSLAALLALLAIALPEVWRAQWNSSWQSIFTTFIAIHFFNSFPEFFFHRYILHAPLIPLLGHFYRQHTWHHSLTQVKPDKRSTVVKVSNNYPIARASQNEASFFPWYSVLAFNLVLAPVFLLGQWLLPNAPVVLGGILATTWQLVLYEIVHAVEHWPLERWARFLQHPRWGNMWQKVYAFHLRHHADIRSNEAISGFFCLPISDWVFGTYKKPYSLYKDGREVLYSEFKSPTLRFGFMRWLDKIAARSVEDYLQKAA